MPQDDNAKYLKQLCAGDRDAFNILFLKYQPKVIAFLAGFLQDNDQAHDMAQDIFLKLWQSREKLSDVSSFNSYIFRMAHNAMCNYFNHTVVQGRYNFEQMLKPIISTDIEENLFSKELEDFIAIRVESMPEKRRTIFKMSRQDGLSIDEIASKMQISRRTVENHLSAALRDIREMINSMMTIFL